MKNQLLAMTFLSGLFVSQHAGFSLAQETDRGPVIALDGEAQSRMERAAVAFLRQSQGVDGSFSSQAGPGVTGLVAAALLSAGVPKNDPMVDKAIVYLLNTKRADGGLYAEGSRHANYETCLAIMALSKVNEQGAHDEILQGAQRFVKGEQWDEGEGLGPKDPAFGGAGYGSKSRPDLSNTAFFIEALRTTGIEESDPAIQRALAFVNRCQNLESPANDTPFASKLNDGGFYYTPAAGGDSMAGKDEATGGLRSYASMTYAGLKSMLYAGVGPEDFRVKAATKFLSKNYSVTSNPGMGPAGLFYYLQTMSKALAMVGNETFESDSGRHAWKSDILNQLLKTQKVDGSWTNPEPRWMEGDPNLVTGYALLTLANLKSR
ncbi:MAG: terpene cyclase/mutase family protein [Planctomycetota bacterium]|nr:terpene cyclase/mutase family protein [Planctomycetota bacterium]